MRCGRGCPAAPPGEEAYSLAMVFKEAMEKLKPRKKITLQVFATDLDRDAIDKARAGRLSRKYLPPTCRRSG